MTDTVIMAMIAGAPAIIAAIGSILNLRKNQQNGRKIDVLDKTTTDTAVDLRDNTKKTEDVQKLVNGTTARLLDEKNKDAAEIQELKQTISDQLRIIADAASGKFHPPSPPTLPPGAKP